jgi:6-phosphogluconolactonase
MTMDQKVSSELLDLLGGTSRRSVLRSLLALATTSYTSLHAPHALALEGRPPTRFAYAGSYSSPIDGGAGNGRGIYLLEMDAITGELKRLKLTAESHNPSWLALHPSGSYLYSVNEVSDYEGKTGSVSAYAVDQKTGDLKLLNVVSSEGAGPAYLSVNASGEFIFVANYNGGCVAVLPLLPTGALGSAVYVYRDTGSIGQTHALNGPPESYAISGHDNPHAHMILGDPGGRFVLHTDLGQDRIYVDRFDRSTGKLTPADPPFVLLPSGDGPRHFVFHPNGRWLYSLQEEASTVVFSQFDPAKGSIEFTQTISTLPPGFRGTSFTSELLLSPDARFLYAANRLHDTIAIFSVQPDGRLQYLGETATEGDYPRHLSMDPDGLFLYACNQRSDSITCFRINRKTGRLLSTGGYTGIGSPTCLIFAGGRATNMR